MRRLCRLLLLLVPLAPGCSDDRPGDAGPFHDPWTVMPSSELEPLRGFSILRGIIHTHSPYSHDACDDHPFVDGQRDEQCFAECRTGMCTTRQDFVFLTDHDDLFAEHEYPDVLLYAEGDELIERGGLPVANRLDCGDGHRVVVAAGTETGMMPIGLEHHVGQTIDERKEIYDRVDADAVRAFQQAGALVFLQHTEGWEVDTILDLPIDGIECYNLHQNLMDNMGGAIEMALKLETDPGSLPDVELAIITIFQENQRDLFRWSKALMHKRMPAVVATDAHRNVFADASKSPDGERIDSFRRMMHWFSNYVLVESRQADDAGLKRAIGAGRLYAAFDYLGYPVGFDYHAEASGNVYEMGGRVPAAPATLYLVAPRVYRLDPDGPEPLLHTRILRAADGAWETVAEGDGDLIVEAGAGVYRAEVRMVPEHLRPWLGPDPERYLLDYPWIYANPIYVAAPE